jgi:hypothetical protein
MLPGYQNASLNQELAIKKQLVQSQKRRYSVVQDTKLLQDSGLASQMNVAIQSNLVTLEALLAEASAHYSTFVMNNEIGFDDETIGTAPDLETIPSADSWDVNTPGSSGLYSDSSYSGSDITGSNSSNTNINSSGSNRGNNLNDVTRVIQEGYVDKSLASSMKSIMIVSNQLKQNISKLQPVLNYLNKNDIVNLIHQLEQVSDRYTDIFQTAQDITNLNLDKIKEQILGKFLIQTEKSVLPVYNALKVLLNSYSPQPVNVSIAKPSSGRQPDGGYNLSGIMASNGM